MRFLPDAGRGHRSELLAFLARVETDSSDQEEGFDGPETADRTRQGERLAEPQEHLPFEEASA